VCITDIKDEFYRDKEGEQCHFYQLAITKLWRFAHPELKNLTSF
jgi:hypothetical protein